MTEKKTKTDDAPVEQVFLDLSTREIVKVSPSGELRISVPDSQFDYYAAMKIYPARNGEK